MNNHSHRALVDIAAKAFTDAYHEYWEDSERWSTYNDQQKENMRIPISAALAAVHEALREPSERMKFVGAHVHDQRYSEVTALWQAMLSASPIVQEE